MSNPHKFQTARERLAQNLKKWRVKRGMSQDVLSATAGLSRVHISRLENSVDTVSLDNLEKLAQALKVDIVDLLLL
jgi:transcriptional regulator with XRE-family HTH domain